MATKVTAEQAAVKYPLESLRNNCRAVFGISPALMRGV